MPVLVTTAPFPVQLSTADTGKVAADNPSTWVSAASVGDPDGVPVPRFSLEQP